MNKFNNNDLRAKATAYSILIAALERGESPESAIARACRWVANKDTKAIDFKCANCRYVIPDTHETDVMCGLDKCKTDYKEVCHKFATDTNNYEVKYETF